MARGASLSQSFRVDDDDDDDDDDNDDDVDDDDDLDRGASLSHSSQS